MKPSRPTLLLGLLPLFLPFSSSIAQEEPAPLEINWIEGPTTANIGGMAEIAVPADYVFAGAEDTKKLMMAMQNPVSGTELGFLAPVEDDWFIVFEFDRIGYVEDDEKDALDADAMLASLRAGTEEGNKIRRQRGWDTLEITGWAKAPFYNPVTNNLEWGTRIKDSSGGESINYNTRLLGRKGVMAVTLVAGPEEFEAIQNTYQHSLATFAYTDGHKYSEWKQGDKIAQYGLTGLVVGGGAALAAKSGLLAKFWMFLLIPLVAAGAFFKKLFGGKSAA